MKKLFERIFPSNAVTPASSPDDALLLRNETQSLRLELEARDERIARLTQEVERLRDQQERLSAAAASARVEALLSEAAAAVSQILTQADLLDRQGKPVQARDVLVVARRLVRALEAHGMIVDGTPGAQVLFDPVRHTAISGSSLAVGQPVTIRFAGVSFQGKTLYKGIVEQETNARSSGS
jgi:molecular chaperone GrpE (heat shock protein)